MEAAAVRLSMSGPVPTADTMGTESKVVPGKFQRAPLSESHSVFPGQPYSVSVLKVGYCLPQTDGTFRADGTITLITGPSTILVDTGGPWDRDFLQRTLKDRGLEPRDIDVVVGTHGHSDHVGNLSLFPTAVMIVGYDISEGDTYRPSRLAEGQAYSIDEYVSVCHTGRVKGKAKFSCCSGLLNSQHSKRCCVLKTLHTIIRISS